MRTIKRSNQFKRDFKRIKANPLHSGDIDALLMAAITLLAKDIALQANNRDHRLSGNWSGFRECHIKADLLLIYIKPDRETLQLARLGTHSDLFG